MGRAESWGASSPACRRGEGDGQDRGGERLPAHRRTDWWRLQGEPAAARSLRPQPQGSPGIVSTSRDYHAPTPRITRRARPPLSLLAADSTLLARASLRSRTRSTRRRHGGWWSGSRGADLAQVVAEWLEAQTAI